MTASPFLDLSLYSGTVSSLADEICSWIRHGKQCTQLICLNPHSYAVARKEPAFWKALSKCRWLIPDGIGVVLGAQFLGTPLPKRIAGHDIFDDLNQRMNASKGRVFLLGASEETLRAVVARLSNDYPDLVVAGYLSPPYATEFTSEESSMMVQKVNAARADVLWVAMTSPKQDLWIAENIDRLEVRFAAGVGAVFDFYSGRIPRSSGRFQRLGLEWLPRLIKEPRRLWRRMLISAPFFVWHVLKAKLRKMWISKTA